MAVKRVKAAKRYLIINAAELIQHIYLENILTSKFKSRGMLHWRRGFAFVSIGNERLWIYSGLTKKIRFDQGRSPEESPIGADGQEDPTFQRTSVGISSVFCTQNRFKTVS